MTIREIFAEVFAGQNKTEFWIGAIAHLHYTHIDVEVTAHIEERARFHAQTLKDTLLGQRPAWYMDESAECADEDW